MPKGGLPQLQDDGTLVHGVSNSSISLYSLAQLAAFPVLGLLAYRLLSGLRCSACLGELRRRGRLQNLLHRMHDSPPSNGVSSLEMELSNASKEGALKSPRLLYRQSSSGAKTLLAAIAADGTSSNSGG